MSKYPKKLVSPDGSAAMVDSPEDEATLRALGFSDGEAPPEEAAEEEAPKRRGRPRKE